MSNFNLPPGCSSSDIPGNRPEDIAWEEFLEERYPEIDDEELSRRRPEIELEFETWYLDYFEDDQDVPDSVDSTCGDD